MASGSGLDLNSGLANIPELRKRAGFTLLMLVVYRLGVFVPTPGIDAVRLKGMLEGASKSLFGMVDMFSGGALSNFSVFALGIMPYISVSIIIQLLTPVVKRLEELSKEGDQGRRVITRITRTGTIMLALVQGLFISIGLENQGVVAAPGWQFRILTAVTLTAGTAFIMWLGEQITERGLGNGISLIIFAGIVARMPIAFSQTVELTRTGELSPLTFLLLLVFGFATVAAIIFVESSQRKIPVQYPRRAVGRMMTQASTQHLPLKVNSAGVMPAIFASSFLGLIGLMATMMGQSGVRQLQGAHDFFVAHLVPGRPIYYLLFAVMIVVFCYFFTALIFDSDKIAENLKKNGGFIPTVRPGKETAHYLSTVLSRLTLWGGVYVCVICILPEWFYYRMGATTFTAFFGGTAVLIVVGVMMDMLSQINTHVVQRNYEAFMNKGPGKVRGGMGRATVQGRLIQR